jgi:hypothetical protein
MGMVGVPGLPEAGAEKGDDRERRWHVGCSEFALRIQCTRKAIAVYVVEKKSELYVSEVMGGVPGFAVRQRAAKKKR